LAKRFEDLNKLMKINEHGTFFLKKTTKSSDIIGENRRKNLFQFNWQGSQCSL